MKREASLETGLYVLVQSGDTMKIDIPDVYSEGMALDEHTARSLMPRVAQVKPLLIRTQHQEIGGTFLS
jgi:hypothetical protein